MHANFLREEAARFRGMADREDSQLRLLQMAADYLANADAKDVELSEVKSAEVISDKASKKIAFRPPKELKSRTTSVPDANQPMPILIG